MKIAFLGNFLNQYSSENDWKTTLEGLGHTVIPMQENHSDTDYIYDQAAKSDLFMWTHTHGWNPHGDVTMTEVLKQLDKKGVPSFSYHLDLWLGIDREADFEKHPFWKVRYKFTVDGEMATNPNHFWVPPAIAESSCFNGDSREELEHDVIFVGSERYHPEWPYRPRLIDALALRYGGKFKRYGSGGEIMRGEDLNALYASSNVVVGDSLCPTFEKPFYWSDRATETMGRGGFLIHPYVKGMDLFFQNEEHLVYYNYGDFEDLFAKIDYYLENGLERKIIATKGMLHVRDNHTYKNRFTQILTTLALLEPQLRGKV